MLTRPVFWNIYENLYFQMKRSLEYEPIVFLCGETRNHVWAVYPEEMPNELLNLNKPLFLSTHTNKNLVDLMESEGVSYIQGFNEDTGYLVNLKDLDPDLVFYCDPYDIYYINDEWKPSVISKKYKTAYIHYGYLLIKTLEFYKLPIFDSAWKVFIESDYHIKIAENELEKEVGNFVSLGYPKFDKYYITSSNTKLIEKSKEYKKTIIYAPHWTISPIKNKEISRYGNFMEHHDYIIGVINKYKDIYWVIKPHPLLFAQIVHSYGQSVAEKIFNKFEKLENVEFYFGHEYIELFKDSNGLILDSNSFVAEYMPSGNPILFLQKEEDLRLNTIGQEVFKGCYFGTKANDIDKYIEEIILKENDHLKEDRSNIIKKYLLTDSNNVPSNEIFRYISSNI